MRESIVLSDPYAAVSGGSETQGRGCGLGHTLPLLAVPCSV